MYLLPPENLSIIALLFLFTFFCASDIRYGLYLIVFFMPLYLVRFSVLGIPTTLLEIMIYVLILTWALKEKRNIVRPFLILQSERMLTLGIILLFSGLFLSTYHSADPRTSLGIFKGWFLDPFLAFVVFISVIKERKDMKNILLSWALSGFGVALIGIYYYLSGNMTFDGRLAAFFLSPNHLAMYLAPAFIIFACLLVKKEKIFSDDRKSTEFILAAIILISFVMLLTRSFGAMFASIASIAYFSFFELKNIVAGNKTKRQKYLIFLTVLFALVIVFSYAKISQIQNSNGRSSLHSRLMIWDASLKIISKSPIIGIGPGTFQEEYLSLAEGRSEPYLEWAVPQPHNVFLAFYLQTGLLGFAGFILILAWFFRIEYKKYPMSDNLIPDVSMVLMAYIIVHGLIDTTYWKNDLSLMFWLVVSMAVIYRTSVFSNQSLDKHSIRM